MEIIYRGDLGAGEMCYESRLIPIVGLYKPTIGIDISIAKLKIKLSL